MLSGNEHCKHSFLYLTFILLIIYLIHTSISPLLGDERVHIKRMPDLPLRFRSDGTFKILQVADMHFGNGLMTRCRDVLASEFELCTDLNTTRFFKRMIDAEKPDFIVFTGDNICGPSTSDAAESLFQVFRLVMQSKLPWAAVLGNHDQESTMTRQELMSFISLMDYSLSQTNPFNFADIDGFGNYNLQVSGAPGTHLANSSILNLFFLDSGDRALVQGVQTYGWIKESQLQWLHGVSQGFQCDLNQDHDHSADAVSLATSPTLAFFHIPIPEIQHLYNKTIVGQFQQRVSCSSVNSGVLHNFVSMGDVKAVFVGHDHTNDFCGNLDGIWFCYGGGFGYHGYGRPGWPRRGRVILAELGKNEKEWLGVKRIMTWKRLDNENLTKIDEQILWDWQPV